MKAFFRFGTFENYLPILDHDARMVWLKGQVGISETAANNCSTSYQVTGIDAVSYFINFARPILNVLGVFSIVAVAWLSTAEAFTSGRKRSNVTEIIVHATSGPSCRRGKVVFSDPGTLRTMTRFFKKSRRVSIHYIVGRNGAISKIVPESRVAIHTRGNNARSVGIEMINEGDGSRPYPEAQYRALLKLVKGIRRRHKVAIGNIKRHSDVDHSTFRCGGRRVRRKQDPGPAFDWNRFRFDLLLASGPKLVRSGRSRRTGHMLNRRLR